MSTSRHILLVEDDSEQAQLFSLVLSKHHIMTAATAEEALEQLTASTFDLLLSDWHLPGMHGDTLIATVKKRFHGVKTVLYSNHPAVRQAGAACSADAWFSKYGEIAGLRQIIDNLLAHGADHA